MVCGSPNGTLCYVSDIIPSKHFWQFTDTVVLKTIWLRPVTTSSPLDTTIRQMSHLQLWRYVSVTSILISFFNLQVSLTAHLAWRFTFFIRSLFTFFNLSHCHKKVFPNSVTSLRQHRISNIFQKPRSHPKLLSTRRDMKRVPQVLGATVQNLVSTAIWLLKSVHPYL